MQGLRQHPFRVAGRLIWFGGEVMVALLVFVLTCFFGAEKERRAARARWLQRTARHVGKIFQLQIKAAGTVPGHGLLVCNHLSYVDILVLVSLTPAVFVAKSEVKAWPVMGWLARMAGTIFIDRQRRMQVGKINAEIQKALEAAALVIIFPEGTSSDGRTVLPFKSPLLGPAMRQKLPLTVGHISYSLTEGDPAADVCYWGDHVFFPHLLNLLSKPTVQASVRFSLVKNPAADRKELAAQLHGEVRALQNSRG